MKTASSRRFRQFAPRHRIAVSAENIAYASQCKPGDCMIARSVLDCIQGASNPSVDIRRLSFSIKANGLRYHYYLPDKAVAVLLAWDKGTMPKPFSFVLMDGFSVPMGFRDSHKSYADGSKKRPKHKPPTTTHRYPRVREFGMCLYV